MSAAGEKKKDDDALKSGPLSVLYDSVKNNTQVIIGKFPRLGAPRATPPPLLSGLEARTLRPPPLFSFWPCSARFANFELISK